MTDRELFTMVLESLESLNRTGDTQVFDMFDAPVLIPALCARLSTCDRCGKVNPAELHTCTPKQKEWVGLTDEEAAQCWTIKSVQTWKNIEAKLKEKNNG